MGSPWKWQSNLLQKWDDLIIQVSLLSPWAQPQERWALNVAIHSENLVKLNSQKLSELKFHFWVVWERHSESIWDPKLWVKYETVTRPGPTEIKANGKVCQSTFSTMRIVPVCFRLKIWPTSSYAKHMHAHMHTHTPWFTSPPAWCLPYSICTQNYLLQEITSGKTKQCLAVQWKLRSPSLSCLHFDFTFPPEFMRSTSPWVIISEFLCQNQSVSLRAC